MKIIRKILYFLGFHKWEEHIGYCACKGCAWYEDSGLIVCKSCDYCKFCYYCSKPKKKIDDITDSAFKTLMIAFKGKNLIEELKQDD